MSGIQGSGGPQEIDTTFSTTSPETGVAYAQSGEARLADIAERLGVPLPDLLQANPQLANPNALSAGQQIQLPPGIPQGTGNTSAPAYDDAGPTAPPVGSDGKRAETQMGATAMRALLSFNTQTPAIGLGQANRKTIGPSSSQTIDVTKDPAFQALPIPSQIMLLATQTNPQASQQLQQVLDNPLYNNLTQTQRTELLNVFANSDSRGRDGLTTLMNREVVIGSGNPPPTIPALLSQDNTSSRTSLLDNLQKLASEPMNAAAADRRGEILGRVIEETGDPTWHLDQGNVGECAPTTIQTHLLLNTPAEYARVIAGLSSTARSATLADGSHLDAAQNDIVPNASVTIAGQNNTMQTIPDRRSVTERMFQGAIQQYGDRSTGGAANFDCNTDQTGLWDNQVANVLHGVYNRLYTPMPPGGQGVGGAVGSSQNQRDGLFTQVKDQLTQGMGPVPVEVIWGANNANQGLHELMVTEVRDGRVFFRNPWGSRDAQGANYKDGQSIAGPPPRRVEDSLGGLESMSLQDFQKRLNGAVIGPQVGGN
jgi:LysM repeat protein